MRNNPRYLLAVLFLISVINFLDRQVLSILQEDIRADLGLTDSQLGTLSLGFGVLYALFAVPIGRLADGRSRKTIIIVCMSLWSAVTSATALVNSFIWLLVARMGVAVGEAGVNPTAHSMISDSFPFRRRARAIAIFGMGIPFGLMLSITLGGLISDAIGWKNTFLVFGIPGLMLALLMYFTVAEPKRGAADGIDRVAEKEPLGTALRRLGSSKAYVFLVAGATAQGLVGYGTLQWLPSYYIRSFGLETGEIALILGPIIGITGIIGIYGTAYLGDRLGRGDVRWYMWMLAISAALSFPFLVAALTVQDFNLSIVLVTVQVFTGTALVGISNAVVQGLAPIRMRSLAAAIKTLCINIVGFGLGAQLVGYLSDTFATGDPSVGLRSAIYVIAFANIVAAGLFLFSARFLKHDFERARMDSEVS